MTEKSSPELETAKERLEQAVARLESMVAKAKEEPDAAAQASAAELAALKAEHETLGKAIEAAEANFSSLRQVTDTVSDRLDATIDQLKSVLER